jgi:hypothetical protein
MTDIEPPSRHERGYLEAFRDANAMPEATRERVWARLAGGPFGPVGGAAANDGPLLEAVSGGGRAWLGRSGLLVGASVAVVTGAIVLALINAEGPVEQRDPDPESPEVAAKVAAVAPPTDTIPELAPVQASEPANIEPPVKAAEPAPVASVAKRSRARIKPVPEVQQSSLADERRLIEQTHAALGRAEADVALALLRQHAREFEAGVFVEEREALLAIATCTAGRLDEGQAAALGFLASYPHAVLAARVRKSCALGD